MNRNRVQYLQKDGEGSDVGSDGSEGSQIHFN